MFGQCAMEGGGWWQCKGLRLPKRPPRHDTLRLQPRALPTGLPTGLPTAGAPAAQGAAHVKQGARDVLAGQRQRGSIAGNATTDDSHTPRLRHLHKTTMEGT